MSIELDDNRNQMRYELLVDGELGSFIQYRWRDGVIEFVHTETEPGFTGQGLAGQLVRAALNDVRQRGLQMRPYCPFVRSYMERHPDYQDLVPAADRDEFFGPDAG